MSNINHVRLNINPYKDLIELAVNEMRKVYSYAPLMTTMFL